MKPTGNGRPEQCVDNLLRISRGEVPYERLKGLSTSIVDSPSSRATMDAEADAEWVLETYEPRVEVNSIILSPGNAEDGHFSVDADITIRKEEKELE